MVTVAKQERVLKLVRISESSFNALVGMKLHRREPLYETLERLIGMVKI